MDGPCGHISVSMENNRRDDSLVCAPTQSGAQFSTLVWVEGTRDIESFQDMPRL